MSAKTLRNVDMVIAVSSVLLVAAANLTVLAVLRHFFA